MNSYPEINANTQITESPEFEIETITEVPEINANTKINELPKFEIEIITKVPNDHPTRQFFYAIFIYIHQVIKLFFHYNIEHAINGKWYEQFYDELSADCIEQIRHRKEQDHIYFQLQGVHCGDHPLWFTLSIKNDSHEGNIPFIQFIDRYNHPLVSFGISLARNTVIYNYEMCFYKWLPIKNVPAEHVTEDVWKYCKYVIKQVRTNMPTYQFPNPDVKNVRISITHRSQERLNLNVEGIPYSIQVTNCCGGMVVHILAPVTEEIIMYFTVEHPRAIVMPTL